MVLPDSVASATQMVDWGRSLPRVKNPRLSDSVASATRERFLVQRLSITSEIHYSIRPRQSVRALNGYLVVSR